MTEHDLDHLGKITFSRMQFSNKRKHVQGNMFSFIIWFHLFINPYTWLANTKQEWRFLWTSLPRPISKKASYLVDRLAESTQISELVTIEQHRGKIFPFFEYKLKASQHRAYCIVVTYFSWCIHVLHLSSIIQ